jgi:FtsH-binding integral membrane protein
LAAPRNFYATRRFMKGIWKFIGETWWIFGLVMAASIAMAYYSGIWPYYVLPPILVVVAVYMGSVRYDSDGNLREEQRMR